jgi:hypothetical protein
MLLWVGKKLNDPRVIILEDLNEKVHSLLTSALIESGLCLK